MKNIKQYPKIYLVRTEENDDNEYWSIFESIEDAINSEGNGSEIYEATPKFLGSFDVVAVLKPSKHNRS
jgi:hypothetical protein